MPFDIRLRQRQIRLFKLTLVSAHDLSIQRFKSADPHLVWHHFTPPIETWVTWSQQEWLKLAEEVLVPEMTTKEGWVLLVPEVQDVIECVKLLDPAPRWGCPLCY